MSGLWSGQAMVLGAPATMGSKRIGRIAGRPVILDNKDARLRSWQGDLRASMLESAPDSPLTGPVDVVVTVYLARPTAHFGTGRNAGTLRASAPRVPIVKPDIDKVLRAVLDCGTGIWWRDDAQCTWLRISKRYADDCAPQTRVGARDAGPDAP